MIALYHPMIRKNYADFIFLSERKVFEVTEKFDILFLLQ